jgi:hypothetical protein
MGAGSVAVPPGSWARMPLLGLGREVEESLDAA